MNILLNIFNKKITKLLNPFHTLLQNQKLTVKNFVTEKIEYRDEVSYSKMEQVVKDGEKWFAFSRMDRGSLEIFGRLNK